jgi:hypothetical protein
MTRRSIVVALVAGLAMALLMSTAPLRTAPAAQRLLDYTPTTGAKFNRPIGTTAQQRAIFTHINKSIDATPPGATIRFAVYSFAEKATATRLINAYQRGVRVQLIFNKHTVYEQERRLRRALGTNPNKGSFAMFCANSCRGTKGQMHQKVFLFSKAGKAENIVMVGSNNMTRNNAVNQWSDIYTVANDPALFFTYSGVFEQMKADVAQSRPYIAATVNGYEPEFYPNPRVTQSTDPLYKALSGVTCLGAAEGYGAPGKVDGDGDGTLDRATVLRIAQHAWNGDRGVYLAQKVAALKRAGCDVKVIYGVGMGRTVKSVLANAAVPMSGGRVKDKHTHQKLLFLSGVYNGSTAATRVWTGSHNWSDGALRRDDAVIEVASPTAYTQYHANFEDIWRNG